MTVVFLDRQHSGNNARRSSLGAVADLDGNGKKEIHEAESMWTAKYLLACELKLREYGYDVIPLSDGRYFERHARCNTYQRQGEKGIYIAAHLNAGVGRGIGYGSMFYDFRSSEGKKLALAICKHLKADLPALQGKAKAISASPENWTKNAWYTIKGVRAVAICAEPCFIDSKPHQALFTDEGMINIGVCIAKGIHDYICGE